MRDSRRELILALGAGGCLEPIPPLLFAFTPVCPHEAGCDGQSGRPCLESAKTRAIGHPVRIFLIRLFEMRINIPLVHLGGLSGGILHERTCRPTAHGSSVKALLFVCFLSPHGRVCLCCCWAFLCWYENQPLRDCNADSRRVVVQVSWSSAPYWDSWGIQPHSLRSFQILICASMRTWGSHYWINRLHTAASLRSPCILSLCLAPLENPDYHIWLIFVIPAAAPDAWPWRGTASLASW